MNITTTYKTNASGTGQILAKGGGKQRTVAYDDSHSVNYNHGTAAGALVLALVGSTDPAKVKEVTSAMVIRAETDWRHEVKDGGKHVFGVTL